MVSKKTERRQPTKDCPRPVMYVYFCICYAVEPHFYRVRYQFLTYAENAPGTPCKVGYFDLYRVIRARLFRIRSAACFRVIRFRQSGQYFAWLELDTKAAPHTVQRRISSVFNSSAYNSLSRGSTAVKVKANVVAVGLLVKNQSSCFLCHVVILL